MDELNPENRFRTVSLGDWLDLARRCDVAHVSAEEVATVRVKDLLEYDTPGPHNARLGEAWRRMEAAKTPGTMLRWDCCASADLKHAMATGRTPDAKTLQQLVIDERIYELASEYPSEDLRIWQRPWIGEQLARVAGYPVEYRAFIRHGKAVAVSSYYPQRPLPERNGEAERVLELAQALADRLEGPILWPAPIPGHPEAPNGSRGAESEDRSIHATADFVVTTKDEVLLLEGGPPHFAGAHPCCFDGRDEVKGIALSLP